MDFSPKQLIGSQTAKGGFQNEHDVVKKFNDYQSDIEAKLWLTIMGYDVEKIEALQAVQIPTRLNRKLIDNFAISEEKFIETQKYKKADIQIQLTIVMDEVIYRENISLKKANSSANFNQIDKRSVDTYQAMWGFDDAIATTLKKFTGVIQPSSSEQDKLKDKRRYYLDELPTADVDKLLDFLNNNKVLIFSDILKGRGMLSAEWFLVTKLNHDNTTDWVLKNINEVINFYAQGDIAVSKQGGLILGRLTAQRKGGTPDPTSLQFKIKPLDLFQLSCP